MKQKNNHARSKRKRKVLLLKNFFKRVIEKRQIKIAKLRKPKGKTFVGNAKSLPFSSGSLFAIFNANKFQPLNQRQKRKIWRNSPQMRKKYA